MTTEKLRIDLPLTLPGVGDVRDGCVSRLLASLSGRPGLLDVHVRVAGGPAPQLCLHYDPAIVSLRRVRELVLCSGAEISAQYAHMTLRATSPMHARAARTLAEQLRLISGVLEADVSPSGAISIEFEQSSNAREQLFKVLEDEDAWHAEAPSGHAATGAARDETVPAGGNQPGDGHAGHDHAKAAAAHEHDHAGPFGEKSELVFSLAGGVLLLIGWLLERSEASPAWASLACYIAAYCASGYYTAREAVANMRARRFEIDSLMLVAAAGAAALGQWTEGALLLFLFSLGHSLEHYAMGRARKAIEALAKLAPETATVRREGATTEVPVGELRIGDTVIVRPNERMPADGVVALGTTSVNQAPVTGESVPVDKEPATNPGQEITAFERVPSQHRVFAGTINGSGAIEIMVARLAGQSTMARVVKMVTEAEAQRSPTQQFTERFERIFVPSVLGLVALLMFAWVVVDEPFSDSFYRAMAVLVAASPCALAISVPSAVLSGVARAGHGGVLVKGGGPLENLGTLSSIAFDKTGTLTEGKPRLTDIRPADGVGEEELLRVALAVEEQSDHPLAGAIVAGARERLAGKATGLAATSVTSITGRGIQAQVDGETVQIGKPALFTEQAGGLPPAVEQTNAELVSSGRTTMIVRQGQRFLGVIGVMDTPRPVAGQVMRELRELGIERLIMISGDNQSVADAVARTVGLTEARGNLMPEEKVQAIQDLRKTHGKVAMVGDGVNDAPAMANATVGIAMGAAGSDVALETADVALMADDLSQLPFAVGLSRQTRRIIKQNLWVSLGVVAVLIPATMFGLNIGTAVLFHEGSTLVVVANALRLLAYGSTKAIQSEPGAPRAA